MYNYDTWRDFDISSAFNHESRSIDFLIVAPNRVSVKLIYQWVVCRDLFIIIHIRHKVATYSVFHLIFVILGYSDVVDTFL
jgi:hypothetical protein